MRRRLDSVHFRVDLPGGNGDIFQWRESPILSKMTALLFLYRGCGVSSSRRVVTLDGEAPEVCTCLGKFESLQGDNLGAEGGRAACVEIGR